MLITFLFPLISLAYGTQFVYNGFQQANLRLKGTAAVHTNGLLQLTNDTQHKVGYAFHPEPVNFTTSRSFSSAFAVAIHPNIPDHGAQGMAFVISPSMSFDQALPDEFLGLVNSTSNNLTSNHMFAIELDTVQNAHFDDIDSNHVGIDVNSLNSTGAASAAYYSAKEGRNQSLLLTGSKAMQVWVDYDEPTMLVSVTIAPIKVEKPSQRLLTTKVNLSGVLLETMYIGFSASTGLTTNDHFVLGWSWSQSGQAQAQAVLDPSKLPSLPRFTSKKKAGRVFVALLIFVLVLIVGICGSSYLIWRKKYEEVKEPWEKEYASHRFSYKDLYKATKGFKMTELLGAGGHGQVYKGVLRKNLQVAIKRISHESGQGMKEFVAELVSMRRLRHRNLVQLLGYCRRKGEILLVYDYMPNGSLDKYLVGDGNPTTLLGWHQRLNIIRGVASALLYLHEEWEQVVLHRDVKASNVMLDANMNARLGDFGLARLYDHGANPRTTHVVGTVGYLAPEFVRTGKATTSCDVFAYGAFVLEVACGRSPLVLEMDSLCGEEEEDLVEWVFNLQNKGSILDASDPKLGGNYDMEQMEMALKIGLLCSQFRPEARPSMRQVVQLLDGTATVPDIPENFNQGGVGLAGAGWETSSSFPSSLFQTRHSASLSSTESVLRCGR